jgi:hypothetical protein
VTPNAAAITAQISTLSNIWTSPILNLNFLEPLDVSVAAGEFSHHEHNKPVSVVNAPKVTPCENQQRQ